MHLATRIRCGNRIAGSALTAAAIALAVGMTAGAPTPARADAGGLSFWLPGVMASLAAVPGQPGWSWLSVYVHLDVSASGGANFVKNTAVVAGLHARSDVLAGGPVYTFATPVLGGQAAFGLFSALGNADVGIDATLTGPRGNTISGSAHDSRTDFSDVFWQGSLKWNSGVHNAMVYATGNIPSGTYDPTRIANLSLGWVAVDAGGGYTYLDPKTGHEFSAVAGLTYNFINPDTQYQNGIDFHLDWAASQFVSKQVQVGLAGYFFQQLTGDTGAGARLGAFKSRVLGIGPQIGFMFPLGEHHSGYLNLRAYKDFAAENRPEGYSAWVPLVLSPAAEQKEQTAKRLATK
jgi:hypothetical protein